MGRVEVLDANGDGKPDIKRVYDKSTGRELCRVVDLNHDGKPDMYEYYNADGSLRRREAAYETSDAISEIATYENGKLVHRERDTTGQRKIDTWDTYDPATGQDRSSASATPTATARSTSGGRGTATTSRSRSTRTVTAARSEQTITVGPNGQAITPPAPSSRRHAAGDAGAVAARRLRRRRLRVLLNTQTDARAADAGAPEEEAGAKK